jgi:hypothetical protein
MNWFERHLNWSLFLGTSLLPFVVDMIFVAILFAVFWGQLAPLAGSGMDGLPEEAFISIFLGTLPIIIIFGLVSLALFGFAIFVAWWYLGKKARSKWFLLLFLGSGVLVGIFANSDIITRLFVALIVLVCIIIFYRLQNKRIGYGGDFVGEPVADHWRPDTGQFGTTDEWQPKELDYSPAKNVQDIAYGGDVKDVRDVGVPSGEVPAAFPPKAPEETPAESFAEIPPEVPPEAPAEAILGTPPGAPVEIPAEAPAETRAEVPPETPVEIPPEAPVEATVEATVESTAEVPAEAKMTEEAVRHETLTMPILLDDAGVAIKCFYHPDADAVNVCSRCRQYVCSQCNYVTGTHPICRNCWDSRAEVPITGVDTGTREGVKLSKSEKIEVEEDERLREFMQLYEQASPIISTVIKREADGSPSSPVELMEGLKLRPMLEHAQKLPKPDGKELQEARKELEQLLLGCIKIAEAAAELVSSGGEAMPSDADLSRLSVDIATVNGLMQGLSQRLASLSQSPGD